ncbi:hypothetical protein [Andreprevotia sp. IGB-42]|uniref:hypothetical protein n=1 Tax=Andreprevotia sp. IGB-42 TaxID=2497473 RepID=UPI001358F788|nr:hypothetical protein [Andreprevotia sp. IGB-42]
MLHNGCSQYRNNGAFHPGYRNWATLGSKRSMEYALAKRQHRSGNAHAPGNMLMRQGKSKNPAHAYACYKKDAADTFYFCSAG